MLGKVKQDLSAYFKQFSYHIPFCILILFYFFLLIYITDFHHTFYWDSTGYLRVAEEIKSGLFFHKDYDLKEGFNSSRTRPPFYSFILAFLGLFFDDLILGGHFSSILFSIFTLIFIYYWCIKKYNIYTGILASFFFIFNPLILRHANTILREPFLCLIYNFLIYLVIQMFKKRKRTYFFLSGIISGIIYITREVGMFIFFYILISSVIYLFIHKLNFKKLIVHYSLIILGFLTFAFPFWFHLKIHTGKWALSVRIESNLMDNFILGTNYKNHNLSQSLSSDNKKLYPSGNSSFNNKYIHIFLSRVLFLLKIFQKWIIVSAHYFYSFLHNIGYVISIGILTYYVIFFKSKPNKKSIFEEAFLFGGVLSIILFYGIFTPRMVTGRYLHPIFPLAMIISASGWINLVRSFKNISGRNTILIKNRVYIFTIFFAFAYFLEFDSQFFKTIKHLLPSYPVRQNEIASKLLLQEIHNKGISIPPNKIFIDTEPFFAFYAKGKNIIELPKSYSTFINLLNTNSADYLIVDSYELIRDYPQYLELIFGYQPPSQYKTFNLPNKRILIIKDTESIIKAPLPNTDIFYSKFFPQYHRIITIYDLKSSKNYDKIKSISINEMENLMMGFYDSNNLTMAIYYANNILKLEPDNLSAIKVLFNSYWKIYNSIKLIKSDYIICDFLVYDLHKYANILLTREPSNQKLKLIYKDLESDIADIQEICKQ